MRTMASDEVVQILINMLQHVPELAGALIGYQGDGCSRVLSYGSIGAAGSSLCIVIEKVFEADVRALAELQHLANHSNGITRNAVAPPTIVMNQSRLGPELVGAGISCGLTVVSAIGVVGGAAAEVPTGGASTFLVIAAWTGLVTGGVQCLNGLVRVGAILRAPNDNTLERWDSNMSYSIAILAVDGIGIAAGVTALPFAVRNLWAVLARQRALVARGVSFESLKAMNRAERLRVISEVFEEAARTPEGRQALVRAAKEAHVAPPGAGPHAGMSVASAVKISSAVSEETARRISSSVRDIVGSLASVGASATPAALTGSASGSVNYIVNIVAIR